MTYLKRGISPQLLLSQIINTMPYLLETQDSYDDFIPYKIFKNCYDQKDLELSHIEYFKLCSSAHLLTCGTFVPTDVDQQIRFKLWPKELPLEALIEMADWVLSVRHWDFTLVSERGLTGAALWADQVLSGHLGEWFTLAAAAYGAVQVRVKENSKLESLRQDLLDAIADEVRRHSEIFASLWKANEGLACLKACALIAHNFGDLDRVVDLWNLAPDDPLRVHFYKLTSIPFDSQGQLRYLGRLWVAGELYKSPCHGAFVFTSMGSSMALENHRHFCLRKLKCLRKDRALLVPIGPFFDDWGKKVAQRLDRSELTEVVQGLQLGWARLSQGKAETMGYGRALCGIYEVHPDLKSQFIQDIRHSLNILKMPHQVFEKSWSDFALKRMDELPSTV